MNVLFAGTIHGSSIWYLKQNLPFKKQYGLCSHSSSNFLANGSNAIVTNRQQSLGSWRHSVSVKGNTNRLKGTRPRPSLNCLPSDQSQASSTLGTPSSPSGSTSYSNIIPSTTSYDPSTWSHEANNDQQVTNDTCASTSSPTQPPHPHPPPPPPLPRYRYRNRTLFLLGLGTRCQRWVEQRLRSELVRRLLATLLLLCLSRLGHFVAVPGFDRKLLAAQGGNWGLPAGTDMELAFFGNEMPLNLFTLEIGPLVFASTIVSIVSQLKLYERWNRLREEGKAGMDELKKDMWNIAAVSAVAMGFLTAAMNQQYRLSPAAGGSSSLLLYYVRTALWLGGGAMVYHWISDRITEDGFGQGSSVLISVGILLRCSDSLSAMWAQANTYTWHVTASLAATWLGCFLVMTSLAAVLLGAKTDVELEYFDVDFEEGSGSSGDAFAESGGSEGAVDTDDDIRPFAPFSLAPQGVTPLFYAHYLCALPKLLQGFGLGLPIEFGASATGLGLWLYYAVFSCAIVALNWIDFGDIPGQLSVYLVKIGARVKGIRGRPSANVDPGNSGKGEPRKTLSRMWRTYCHGCYTVGQFVLSLTGVRPSRLAEVEQQMAAQGGVRDPPRPGEETQVYLQVVQDSTRLIGGVLLALLSVGSNVFDNYVNKHFKGSTIGFSSMLIIVGSIISMRRTYEAYQQMPELERVIAKYKFNFNEVT